MYHGTYHKLLLKKYQNLQNDKDIYGSQVKW